MDEIAWLVLAAVGVAAIVWGAETFAEHLSGAANRLQVSVFALALVVAGAEPEELATAVVASLRDAPALAIGNVVGSNAAICLVALGAGALIAPLPFDPKVRRYALFGIPAGAFAAALAWDGTVNRTEALLLIAAYAVFIGIIWMIEREPPVLGEAAEHQPAPQAGSRIGRELALVLVGFAAMAVGATALVEGITRVATSESSQTRVGLVLVGFATALELVVLTWSASRRGITSAAVAGVIGSFTYNVTMTLGAGALARPLRVSDASILRGPWLAMLLALVLVIALATPRGSLGRRAGAVLLAAYVAFAVYGLTR